MNRGMYTGMNTRRSWLCSSLFTLFIPLRRNIYKEKKAREFPIKVAVLSMNTCERMNNVEK